MLGDICYPKSEVLIIPANSKGIMSKGILRRVVKHGWKGLEEEAKKAGKSYWTRLAEYAFTSPPVALGILKKFIPDIQKIEGDQKKENTHILFTEQPTKIEIAFTRKYMVGELKETFMIEYDETLKKEREENRKALEKFEEEVMGKLNDD